MTQRDRKLVLRRRVLLRRGQIAADARERAARDAAERLMDLPEVRAARSVAGFAAFGSEISTDPLLDAILASGKTVLMPAVRDGTLTVTPIAGRDDLAPGYRGILEPRPEADRRDPPAPDVVVVPGVAFDGAGRRLGYGGGFYDEFLTASPGLRIGFCFECQVVEEVPVEPHDQAVAIVVTEARVLRTAATEPAR